MTRKGFATALGLKVAAIALGLVMLGLPGAAIFELSYPVIRLVYGEEPRVVPDAAWPVAIYITLLWPASFLPVAWLASLLFPAERRTARAAFVIALLVLWGVALSLVLYTLARRP